MLSEPKVVVRRAEAFAAMLLEVTQPDIAAQAPPLIADVMDWVKAQGGGVSGPPFFNYTAFLPGGRMTMAVGVPTAALLEPRGNVTTGMLPAGKYASITHSGDYAGLYEANMALDRWIAERGLTYAGQQRGDSFVEATRLEIYREPGGPTTPPVTEVAFRLTD